MRQAMYELRWTPENLSDPVTVDLVWVDGNGGFDRGGLAGATLYVDPGQETLGLIFAFGGGLLLIVKRIKK